MDKRLVFHIGLHKTGSTYIQHSLFEQRQKLLEQGFCYPKLDHRFAHHYLGSELRHGYLLCWDRKQWKQLHQYIESTSYPLYLISTESLDRVGELAIDFVASLTAKLDLNVEIAMFLRNQIDSIESSALGTNRYYGMSLENEERLRNAMCKPRFHHTKFVHDWMNRFGSQNVHLKVYEKSRDLMDSFFELIRWQPDQPVIFPKKKKVNSRRDARVVLLAKQFIKTIDYVPKAKCLRRLMCLLGQASNRMNTERFGNTKRLTLFDDHYRQRLFDYFEPINRETHQSLIELTDHYFTPDRNLEFIDRVDREYAFEILDKVEPQPEFPLLNDFARYVESLGAKVLRRAI